MECINISSFMECKNNIFTTQLMIMIIIVITQKPAEQRDCIVLVIHHWKSKISFSAQIHSFSYVAECFHFIFR